MFALLASLTIPAFAADTGSVAKVESIAKDIVTEQSGSAVKEDIVVKHVISNQLTDTERQKLKLEFK